MSVVLAAAWQPRGELRRFQRLRSLVDDVYDAMTVILPPGSADSLEADYLERTGADYLIADDWSHGRHLAISRALQIDRTHIHYADFDRLVHWIELNEKEWSQAVQAVEKCDCLIIGRTPRAYATHPQALVQTERISNKVFSYYLGRPMDLSAGSKGLSQVAAAFLVAHSPPGRALGMDSEWPILLSRADYQIDYVEADGLDWESADRYQAQAASAVVQRRAAEEYDRDPSHWARRAAIAQEIVEAGMDALTRRL